MIVIPLKLFILHPRYEVIFPALFGDDCWMLRLWGNSHFEKSLPGRIIFFLMVQDPAALFERSWNHPVDFEKTLNDPENI